MAHGDTLLTSNKDDLVEFKHYCLRTFLPVSYDVQGCESAIKDTVHAKKKVREEDTTSLIAMTRSYTISKITLMTTK